MVCGLCVLRIDTLIKRYKAYSTRINITLFNKCSKYSKSLIVNLLYIFITKNLKTTMVIS